ncbi:MAG: hypothetical protein OK422_00680 [Thaumarchaeota archaeon]|nr:hypothetical protein [Nitrososphaerota archaeon]
MHKPIGLNSELAELVGVLLGDGCLSVSISPRHAIYAVAFTASTKEFQYYENFVKPTLESEFGIRGHLYLRKDNTTRYHVYCKELVSYLAGLGIPVGKKKDAAIPATILEHGLTIPFIRGFYHAEGSLYRRYSKAYNRHVKIYDNLGVIHSERS